MTYDHCAKLIHRAQTQNLEERKRRDRLRRDEELLTSSSSENARSRSSEETSDEDHSMESEAAAFSSSPESNFYKKRQGTFHRNQQQHQHKRKKLVSKRRNQSARPEENEVGYEDDYDDRIMSLLYNMTSSVLQATSYFRQSSRVMEEILSNTGTLVGEQSDLKRDLGIIKVSLYNPKNGTTLHNRGHPLLHSTVDSTSAGKIFADNDSTAKLSHNPLFSSKKGLEECKLSAATLGGLQTIVKNGSQLLEVRHS